MSNSIEPETFAGGFIVLNDDLKPGYFTDDGYEAKHRQTGLTDGIRKAGKLLDCNIVKDLS